MFKHLRESLEGIGIGLVAGLVIGMSNADWLRVVITLALISYAAKIVMDKDKADAGNSYRMAFTGFAAFFAVLLGLYLHGQQVFRQSAKEGMDYWVKAGFSESQARTLWLQQSFKDLQPKSETPGKMQTIIQNISNPVGLDSLVANSSGFAQRLDSLQNALALLQGGTLNATGITDAVNQVSKNLFSSAEAANLCTDLDPDANPGLELYFKKIEETALPELIELTLKDTLIAAEERYNFAMQIHKMICTIQADKSTDWLKILNPSAHQSDVAEMFKIYTSQEKPVFAKLAAWISTNAKNQNEYFAKIYALVKKVG